jgi:hypothetical protein
MKARRIFHATFVNAILVVYLFTAPQVAAESLSSTNLIWDSMVKTTNIVTGEKEAHFTFAFTNVSSSNATILGVQTSCGCTTAQLPPLPWVIAPGTNGQIGIKVNIAATSGTLSKTVTVATDKDSEMLTVKIVILTPPAPAMPATNRLQDQMVK